MPKTTKRLESKRAERIIRAHQTDLPKQVKNRSDTPASLNQKEPARGLARYPWATFLLVVLFLGITAYTLNLNHVWPFNQQPNTQAQNQASNSACLNSDILAKIEKKDQPKSDEEYAKIQRNYSAAPAMSIDASKKYCAGINTSKGLIVVELDPSIAPKTVNNFVYLANSNFYDGLAFGRVLKDGAGAKIIQGGDPEWKNSDATKRGTGGPGYKFEDETVQGEYTEGVIAMANNGANTNGSQFFINTGDNSKFFEKKYNLFGKVVRGLDIAKQITGPADGQKLEDVAPDRINYVVVVAA